MRRLLLLVGLSCSLFSCNKGDEGGDDNVAVSMTNVSYGANPQQAMDVYLPAGRSATSTKVMIMIHGGAWNAGDKSDFTAYVDSMKAREPSYAIFNLNYRLAGSTNLFPAQELDIKAAVEFIFNKKDEYRISDKFVLVGASAGGHLALLQGYKYTSTIKPKAIIDFFGPVELIDMYNNPPNPFVPGLLSSVTGGTPTSNNTIYTQSSPINFVTAQSAPTLILHGGIDFVVAPSQSVLLNSKLATLNVPHQYIFYPTEGHGWVGPGLTDSFNKIQAFLATHVN